MLHIDLFSGIGGFAIAADRVWHGIEHVFVEYDQFCQAILRKHYPNSTIHGDIRTFIADTEREGREGELRDTEGQHRLRGGSREDEKPFLVTGGFPCQPFSHAGRRKGTSDDRYLWPEMFRVIQLYRPTWVIAENVRGLVTWNYGMVLETVCTDLENEGYEVQPFIIPACAVGAPHRRDRVWIIAHTTDYGQRGEKQGINGTSDSISQEYRTQDSTTRELERTDSDGEIVQLVTDTRRERRSARASENVRPAGKEPEQQNSSNSGFGWNRDWREVALATCYDGVDDGLPRQMDGVTISGARHRKERLKACGNAIVPQVAEQIMIAMRDCE